MEAPINDGNSELSEPVLRENLVSDRRRQEGKVSAGYHDVKMRPIPEPTEDNTTNISKKRRAFLVANTYEESELRTLEGTETSMIKMKTALEEKGFETTEFLNE